MEEPLWNSLEKAKLAVAMLTPIIVLIIGIFVSNSIKDAERSSGLRSDIYNKVGGELNDIYSYVAFVGKWKELTPADIIASKRTVDKAMYTYKPFFSKELFATYERFMNECFSPYGAPGEDARIRSQISTLDGDRRKHTVKAWQPAWQDRFTDEAGKKASQRLAYDQFLEQLARDLKL